MPPLRSRKTEAKESEAFHSFCLFVKGVLEVPSESVGHGKRVGIVYVGKCLINEYIYMRVVLNSFLWKPSSSPKINLLSPNFSEHQVYLWRHMLAKTGKKTLMCDILKFVPGACSPVTLHSVAAALKHYVLL